MEEATMTEVEELASLLFSPGLELFDDHQKAFVLEQSVEVELMMTKPFL